MTHLKKDKDCDICFDTRAFSWWWACNRCHKSACAQCYMRANAVDKGCPYCRYDIAAHFDRIFKLKGEAFISTAGARVAESKPSFFTKDFEAKSSEN